MAVSWLVGWMGGSAGAYVAHAEEVECADDAYRVAGHVEPVVLVRYGLCLGKALGASSPLNAY